MESRNKLKPVYQTVKFVVMENHAQLVKAITIIKLVMTNVKLVMQTAQIVKMKKDALLAQ